MWSYSLPEFPQVVDMLALHLPPEKLCPHVVSETLLLLLALGRYSPLKPRTSGIDRCNGPIEKIAGRLWLGSECAVYP